MPEEGKEDELKRAIRGLEKLRKERPEIYSKVMAEAVKAARAAK